MTKYTMNTANAVFFLNLWEPHANYFYQAGEAKAWADYFGYEADFGGGTALDLPRYYTMCNDLLHALENYPEIIALHKAYAEQELGGIDDALHLLVYDILHTAYAEQFYPKGLHPRLDEQGARKGCEGEGGPRQSSASASASVSRSCRSCWRTLLRCPT